jgi:hypothetical protein
MSEFESGASRAETKERTPEQKHSIAAYGALVREIESNDVKEI